MARTEKKEVFISYTTRTEKNKNDAQYLCNLLEGAGISCWIAPRDIGAGQQWANAIMAGISETDILALLVSEASMGSAECAKEVDIANSDKKMLLPIRIEDSPLKEAFKYHLSDKQWVDALEGEGSERFQAAVDAILVMLNKESVDKGDMDGGISGAARLLANNLNGKYRLRLDTINAMFSIQKGATQDVVLFFPIRIGATGVDLIFKFSTQKKTIDIYADSASDGDPLKYPFVTFFQKEKSETFKDVKRIPGARRWNFVALLKEEPLTNKLAGHSLEKCFDLFKDNIEAFSDKIFPGLLDWIDYAGKVEKTISRLEEKLKEIFPETEDWMVGAPEGERLSGFRQYGKLNVFKKDWQPQSDNYRGRGLLSFTLESGGHFLNGLYIGILKYESWMTLGDWESRITDRAIKIMEQTEKPEPYWPWWQLLDGKWRNSGIADISFDWQDDLDGFIEYCVGKFKKLKDLEVIIGDACNDIPRMQLANPLVMEEERRTWNNGLYIYNYLRMITEKCNQKASEAGMTFSFMSRNLDCEWITLETYLTFKVEEFDAVAAFTCTKKNMAVMFKNLEPPDFETEIIKAFIKNRGLYTIPKNITVSDDFEGKSIAEWLARYESFVTEEIDKILPEFIMLRNHLEAVKNLVTHACKVLEQFLVSETGVWKVENKAISLEKMAPISIWHSTWRKSGANDDDLPPVMLQIIPTEPCFDGLVVSLKQNEQIDPKFEHQLGMLCGACEFAFGKSHDTGNLYGIWSANLANFTKTGGSNFDWINDGSWPLIAGERCIFFDETMEGLAKNILKMEPLIKKLCNDHNYQVHFIGELQNLIDGLTNTLKTLFPEKDGWKMYTNAKTMEKYAGISFYKEAWKKPDQDKSTYCLTLQAGTNDFDNLFYGIQSCDSTINAQNTDFSEKIKKIFLSGRSERGWPWWQYADAQFRNTAGTEKKVIDEKNQYEMQSYFKEKFKIMKEQVTPLIDELLADNSEKKTKEESSEVMPA